MVMERSPKSAPPPLPARPRTFRRNCGDQVSVTSPTKVYIETSAKSPHYSLNDVSTKRKLVQEPQDSDERVRLIKVLEQTCWLCVKTVLLDGEFEVQDLVAFIDGDSSESGHLYESLEPPPITGAHLAHGAHVAHTSPVAHALPLDDDFDSFDSDSDPEDHDQSSIAQAAPPVPQRGSPHHPTGVGPTPSRK
ncbi:unnamed protein product, partial [Iphiclides podalirius]